MEATQERIKLSQSPSFDGTSNTNTRGPWDKESLEEAINQWNDDILGNALIGEDVFNRAEGFNDWEDDGPTSYRDIINDCDYDYYYSGQDPVSQC